MADVLRALLVYHGSLRLLHLPRASALQTRNFIAIFWPIFRHDEYIESRRDQRLQSELF